MAKEPEKKDKEQEQEVEMGTTVLVTPDVWSKMLFMRDQTKNEVMGFGVAEDPKALLRMTSFELVKQEVGGAHAEMDGDGLADWTSKKLMGGLEVCQCMRLYVHTHPGNMAEPSNTDMDDLRNNFGECDWVCMIIIHQKVVVPDDVTVLFFANTALGRWKCPGDMAIDWTHGFRGVNDEVLKAWKEEYDLNVKEPVSHASYMGSGYELGRSSGFWDTERKCWVDTGTSKERCKSGAHDWVCWNDKWERDDGETLDTLGKETKRSSNPNSYDAEDVMSLVVGLSKKDRKWLYKWFCGDERYSQDELMEAICDMVEGLTFSELTAVYEQAFKKYEWCSPAVKDLQNMWNLHDEGDHELVQRFVRSRGQIDDMHMTGWGRRLARKLFAVSVTARGVNLTDTIGEMIQTGEWVLPKKLQDSRPKQPCEQRVLYMYDEQGFPILDAQGKPLTVVRDVVPGTNEPKEGEDVDGNRADGSADGSADESAGGCAGGPNGGAGESNGHRAGEEVLGNPQCGGAGESCGDGCRCGGHREAIEHDSWGDGNYDPLPC